MTGIAAEREAEAAENKLPPQVRKALLALIVGGIAAILDSTMVTLALHTLVVRLHSTDGTIQWVTTGYLLAMAVAIPVTGWAESRWGGKRVWMAALVIFVLGSVLCAFSWSDTSLIGFRVLQGFGAGLIFPLMQTLGVRAAGGRASSNLIAAVSLPLALGPILGPVIGGVILNWLSWRWLFLVNVPVIAVGLVLAWRLLPADRPAPGTARPRLDVTGLVLLGPALAGILLGLSNLSDDGGIDHAGVLVPLLAGVALLGAFCAWALAPGGRQPIVDIRLLRLRSLGTAATVLFTGVQRCTPPCSCCRSTTSSFAARRCCTPGCCSSPRASARWPPASWSAGSSPGSAPACSRSAASCSPPSRPCRSHWPARTPACGYSAPHW